MKKKQYFIPKTEVLLLGTTELMYLTGPASAPPDNYQGAPRKRWTDVF